MIRRVALITLFLSCAGVPAWAGTLPVTLAWDPNPEPSVIGYRLYVGTTSGSYSTVLDVGNVTTFTLSGGTVGVRYYLAVSAYVTGLLEGPRSAEVSTVVQSDTTVGGTTPPPPPDDGGGGGDTTSNGSIVLERAVVSGSTVNLNWKPSGGLKVLEYLLEAGSGPGLSDVFNGTIGTTTRITGTVGPGTYYVRVRARTSSASSVASNEVSFSMTREAQPIARRLRRHPLVRRVR